LLNLISNSFKFTEKGSIIICISDLSDFREDQSIKLGFRIEDTGIGIPSKELPTLFKMFNTTMKHRDTFNMKGTGLGLTITK